MNGSGAYVDRIRQLLLEVDNHEWNHQNGRERIMRNLKFNVEKLKLALEREDNPPKTTKIKG